MKKVKGLLVGMVMFGVLMMCCFIEQRYTREVTVSDVKGEVVTVVDEYEHEWEFVGTGFKVGQEIKVLMNNNSTDRNILDDEIVRVID